MADRVGRRVATFGLAHQSSSREWHATLPIASPTSDTTAFPTGPSINHRERDVTVAGPL
jgi:hypothetical protein